MAEEKILVKRTLSDGCIAAYVSEIFETKALSDVTLHCNGANYGAHKALLGLHLPSLRHLLDSDVDVVFIPDMQETTLVRLLRFMYVGVLSLAASEIGDFLELTKHWGLDQNYTVSPNNQKGRLRLRNVDLMKEESKRKPSVDSSRLPSIDSSSSSFKENCTVCDAELTSRSEKELHERVHGLGQDRFACRYCMLGFKDRSDLEEHRKVHTSQKELFKFICKQVSAGISCGQTFKSFRHLGEHMLEEHYGARSSLGGLPPDADVSKCNICLAECSEDMLQIHHKIHKSTSMFECEFCLAPYSDMVSLLKHRKIHPEKMYQCRSCHASHSSIDSLYRHILQPCTLQSVSKLESEDKPLDTLAPVDSLKDEVVPGKPGDLDQSRDQVDDVKLEETNICDICLMTTKDFSNHARFHRSGFKYECMYCLTGFPDFESMKSHVDSHGNKFQCSSCAQTFEDFLSLGNHSLTCTCIKTDGQPSSDSESTRKDTSSPSRLQRTELDCSEVYNEVQVAYLSCPKAKLRYECPLCRMNLGPNKISYNTHLKLHSGPGEFTCKYCYSDQVDPDRLLEHIRSNHKDKRYSCPSCSLQTSNHSALLLHFDTVGHLSLWTDDPSSAQLVEYENKSYGQESLCESSPNIECRLCFEELDNLELFYSHVKIHSGRSEFECKYCFTGFPSLQLHSAHLDADHPTDASQKYTCPYCDFATKNKNLLIKHARYTEHWSGVDLKVAPFRKIERASKLTELAVQRGREQKICPVCQMGLEGERALKSHQKLHVTGFAYECMYCLMGFSEEGRLSRHRAIHNDHWECLTCSDEFDSYTRFLKHLEDTCHHERYSDCVNRYGTIPKTPMLDLTSVTVVTDTAQLGGDRNLGLRKLNVRVAKFPGCGVCDRCRREPCKLCLSCQRGRNCRFKKCQIFDTVEEAKPASALAEKSSASTEKSSASAEEPEQCHVCHVSIPKMIQHLHRDIHCAAFGVADMSRIQANQCMYCLKIMFNKSNFQKHVETHHILSKKPGQFLCVRCNLETSSLIQFINHLHINKHFPNKMGRKLGANSRLARKRRLVQSTPVNLIKRIDKVKEDNDGGKSNEDEEDSNLELEDVDGGGGGGEEGRVFTCNQCNLSFNTLLKCSSHMKKHRRSINSQTRRKDSLESSPVAALRRNRRNTSRRSTTEAPLPATPSIPPCLPYRCSRCPFATDKPDQLFGANGHMCGEEPNNVISGGGSGGERSNTAGILTCCARCQLVVRNMEELDNHMKNVHARRKRVRFERRSACGYCKACSSADSAGNEDSHCILVELHAMALEFRSSESVTEESKCLICGETLKVQQLLDHIQMHSGIHSHACRHCYKEFSSAAELTGHTADCRFRKTEKFKCLLCSTVESGSEDLLFHFTSVHSTRLNWTVKTLIDGLFDKNRHRDEDEEDESDLGDQPPADSSLEEKIVNILEKHVKDQAGISLSALQELIKQDDTVNPEKLSLQEILDQAVDKKLVTKTVVDNKVLYSLVQPEVTIKEGNRNKEAKKRLPVSKDRRRSKRIRNETIDKPTDDKEEDAEDATMDDFVVEDFVESQVEPCIAYFEKSDSESEIDDLRSKIDSFLKDDIHSSDDVRSDQEVAGPPPKLDKPVSKPASKLDDFADLDPKTGYIDVTDLEPSLYKSGTESTNPDAVRDPEKTTNQYGIDPLVDSNIDIMDKKLCATLNSGVENIAEMLKKDENSLDTVSEKVAETNNDLTDKGSKTPELDKSFDFEGMLEMEAGDEAEATAEDLNKDISEAFEEKDLIKNISDILNTCIEAGHDIKSNPEDLLKADDKSFCQLEESNDQKATIMSPNEVEHVDTVQHDKPAILEVASSRPSVDDVSGVVKVVENGAPDDKTAIDVDVPVSTVEIKEECPHTPMTSMKEKCSKPKKIPIYKQQEPVFPKSQDHLQETVFPKVQEIPAKTECRGILFRRNLSSPTIPISGPSRKVCQRKKFGSVNTKFVGKRVTTNCALGETDDAYSTIDFSIKEDKSEPKSQAQNNIPEPEASLPVTDRKADKVGANIPGQKLKRIKRIQRNSLHSEEQKTFLIQSQRLPKSSIDNIPIKSNSGEARKSDNYSKCDKTDIFQNGLAKRGADSNVRFFDNTNKPTMSNKKNAFKPSETSSEKQSKDSLVKGVHKRRGKKSNLLKFILEYDASCNPELLEFQKEALKIVEDTVTEVHDKCQSKKQEKTLEEKANSGQEASSVNVDLKKIDMTENLNVVTKSEVADKESVVNEDNAKHESGIIEDLSVLEDEAKVIVKAVTENDSSDEIEKGKNFKKEQNDEIVKLDPTQEVPTITRDQNTTKGESIQTCDADIKDKSSVLIDVDKPKPSDTKKELMSKKQSKQSIEPEDYEKLCLEAVKDLDKPDGCSAKMIRTHIQAKHGFHLQNQVIDLCLGAAAVSGQVVQSEYCRVTFYKLSSEQPIETGDMEKDSTETRTKPNPILSKRRSVHKAARAKNAEECHRENVGLDKRKQPKSEQVQDKRKRPRRTSKEKKTNVLQGTCKNELTAKEPTTENIENKNNINTIEHTSKALTDEGKESTMEVLDHVAKSINKPEALTTTNAENEQLPRCDNEVETDELAFSDMSKEAVKHEEIAENLETKEDRKIDENEEKNELEEGGGDPEESSPNPDASRITPHSDEHVNVSQDETQKPQSLDVMDRSCPVCFRLLLNSDRMRKHMSENHPDYLPGNHQEHSREQQNPRDPPTASLPYATNYFNHSDQAPSAQKTADSDQTSRLPQSCSSYTENPGIKLKINLRSPSAEPDLEKRRDEEAKHGKRTKRPRQNIPDRVEMFAVKRMKLTFGDEVVGERRIVHQQPAFYPGPGRGVMVSKQPEPLIDYIVDMKRIRRGQILSNDCEIY